MSRSRSFARFALVTVVSLAACLAPPGGNDGGIINGGSDVTGFDGQVVTDVQLLDGADVIPTDGPVCAAPRTLCGTDCVDLQTDTANCGGCSNVCATGLLCVAGRCQLVCPDGQTACNGTCVLLSTDNANCGACGRTCPDGTMCSLGTCATTCATGLATCTGPVGDGGVDAAVPTYCADLSNDRLNCGACGVGCADGEICVDRACVPTCAFGQLRCGTSCRDVTSDRMNCGSCGNACAVTESCVAGRCEAGCGAGTIRCGDRCRDPLADPESCGGCGIVCPAGDNARALCTSGRCGITCSTGFADCDGMPSNGCETALDSVSNCRGCGVSCTYEHASGICGSSGCSLGTCNTGFRNCNSDATDGCEVNTQTDPANCGACGRACGAGLFCQAGACVAVCTSPLVACNGGCVDPRSDAAHCGGCGMACATRGNAGALCSAGNCVYTCTAGFGDCDGAAGNGCETALNTNASCRGCGITCAYANAGATCGAAGCAMGACNPGFADCNLSPADGCEVDTRSSPDHCGGCGIACGAGRVCANGACVASCASPLLACSGLCVDPRSNLDHCGGCDQPCGARANALSLCGAGSCRYVCQPGFGDCDGATSTGCEAPLTTTANCGGCGVACNYPNAAASCVRGACAMGACAGSFRDCNTLAADGCETDIQTSAAHCGACGNACGGGRVCQAGMCVSSCAAPLVACGGTCRNFDNDAAACGACGNVCPSGPNAATFCASGQCGIRCASGFGDCDFDPRTGCESSLDTVTNCRGCGISCSYPNASATCGVTGCQLGTCATGFGNCNNRAADGCEAAFANDPRNCGACGNACATGQVCNSGRCVASCTTGLTACDSACKDLQNDPTACGSCTRVCPTGPSATALCTAATCGIRCDAGFGDCDGLADNGCETRLDGTANCGACGRACSLPNGSSTCSAGACGLNACNPGFQNCNGQVLDGCEVDTNTDRANCGACAHACGAGEMCQSGTCVASCAAPQLACNGACRDFSNDPGSCGTCGNACPTGANATATCASAMCGIRCNAGFADCNASAGDGCEIALDTTANCRACGVACSYAHASAACASTGCRLAACDDGYADCNGNTADGCESALGTDPRNCGACAHACGAGEACVLGACVADCALPLRACAGACRDLSNDVAHCGVCEHACPSGSNATATCARGTCGIACASGFSDCDGDPASGCETALGTASNCGGCGAACAYPNAQGVCNSGTCALGTCADGFADCNHSAVDGCEVRLALDRANCGACAHACGAGESCQEGACVASCAAPLAECNGACRNFSNDPGSCGTCGNVCPTGAHATAVCGTGVCGLVCDAGYGNCDGQASNGCEADLGTVGNCRSCGVTCAYPHAAAACGSAGCSMGTCDAGYRDCNGSPADGCEAAIDTDNAHCGACNNACGAGQVCQMGSCVTTCARPLSVCDGSCRNFTNDPLSCGGCGNVCPSGANSTANCAESTCGLVCGAGFGNCDGQATNGCETPLNSTANCGLCGVACSYAHAAATCGASGCQMGLCAANFGDCNTTALDGCETDLLSNAAHCGACGHACGAGESCQSGMCVTSCASPYQSCNGTCRNFATDPGSCGTCGNVCPSGSNSTATCATGACGLRCDAGFGDCDGQAATGCETALDTTAHCGTCAIACSFPNAAAACTAGACALSTCNDGFGNCNSNAADGCETVLGTDPRNCGACGHGCGAGETCVAGTCQISCGAPTTACSGVCRDLNVDPTACGSCTHSCPTGANGNPVCTGGSCSFLCTAGNGDCNADLADGCETSLTTTSNCRACGLACPPILHGSPSCTSAGCGVGTCDEGYGNCNGMSADGCETGLVNNDAACGTCGNACAAGTVCVGTSCVASCRIGRAVFAAGASKPGDPCYVCDPARATGEWSTAATGTACDDGNACTQTDACAAGSCVGSNPVVCAAQDQCHLAGICDPGTGTCSNPAKMDGTTCTDGNACTQTDTCQAGACVGSNPVVCAAQDQCHVAGSCNQQSGQCSNPPVENGSACNDTNACTQTDTCQAGACVGSNPVECVAIDGCHLAGVCNTTTGACTNPNAPNGTECNDENPCTQTDTCQAGACTGTNPVTCRPSDPCHVAGVCEPATGSCTNPPAIDGTTCTDGNLCTQIDACQAGTCVGASPVLCAPLDQCHVAGVCNPDTGACSNPMAEDGTGCNDTNACTQTDTCQAGTCTGSNPVTCTALDACHVPGACNPATGACSNPLAEDGTTCGVGQTCIAGTCSNCNTDTSCGASCVDCTANPAASHCSPAGSQCVQCTTNAHCGLGLYCNLTTFACEACNVNAHCGTEACADCTASSGTPVCEPESRTCVECVQGADCASGSYCDAENSCSVCNTNLHCGATCMSCSDAPGQPSCNGTRCVCTTNSSCISVDETRPWCVSGDCSECRTHSDCEDVTKPICTSGTCTACTSNEQCVTKDPGFPYCVSGQCVECNSVADCPSSENECLQAACTEHVCGFAAKPYGTLYSAQPSGDCHTRICNGEGDWTDVVNDSDPPSDAFQCTTESCNNGTPVNGFVNAREACTQGGVMCDGAGHCVNCTLAGDCGSASACASPVCNSGTCGTEYVLEGTAASTEYQTPNDCQIVTCNGAGTSSIQADDTDLPVDDGNPCTDDLCSAGSQTHPAKEPGTTCPTGVCSGTSCVECLTVDQCSAGGANTSAMCSGNACAYACQSGYLDCNASSGCETQNNQVATCGSCSNACPSGAHATATCADPATSTCGLTCDSGYGNCNASSGDGCETVLNTAAACGSCSNVCTAPANATATCVDAAAGTCGFTCNAGYGDCNGIASDGCEVFTPSCTDNPYGVAGIIDANVGGTFTGTIGTGNGNVGAYSACTQPSATSTPTAGGKEAIYALVVSQTMQVQLDTYGSTGVTDTVLAVRSSAGNGATQLACSDDVASGDLKSAVRYTFNPGTYYVIVDQFSATTGGAFVLHATPLPTIPSCASAIDLSSGAAVTGQNLSAGATPAVACANVLSGGQNFYTVTVPANSKTTVTTTLADATRMLQLNVQAACGSASCDASTLVSGVSGGLTIYNRSPSDPITRLVEVSSAGLGTATLNRLDWAPYSIQAATSTLPASPANATCATPTVIGDETLGNTSSSLTGESTESATDLLTSCTLTTGRTLYYQVTVNNGSRVVITATPTLSTFDPTIRLLSACGATTCTASANTAGANAAETLSFANSSGSTQTYVVAVAGNGASEPANLGTFNLSTTISPLAVNATCAGAVALTGGMAITTPSTIAGGATTAVCNTGGNQLYYSIAVPDLTRLTVSANPVSNTAAAPTVRILDGCAAGTCSGSATSTAGGTATATFDNASGATKTMIVSVSTTSAIVDSTFNLVASTSGIAAGSVCAVANTLAEGMTLTGDTSIVPGTNGDISVKGNCTPNKSNVVWYRFTTTVANQKLRVRVTPTAAGFDPVVRVLSYAATNPCSVLGCAAAFDAAGPGQPETLYYTAATVGTYYIAVGGTGQDVTSTGTFDVSITTNATPPTNTAVTSAALLTLDSTITTPDTYFGGTATSCNAGGNFYFYTASLPANTRVTARAMMNAALAGTPATVRIYTSTSIGTCTAVGQGVAGDYGTAIYENTGASAQTIYFGVSPASSNVIANGTLSLSTATTAAFSCAGVTPTALTDGTTLDNQDLATQSVDVPAGTGCSTTGLSRAAYYTATVPANGQINVTVRPTGYWDPVIRFMSSCGGACSAGGSITNTNTSGKIEVSRYINATASPVSVLIAVMGGGVSTIGKYSITASVGATAANATCANALAVSDGTVLSGQDLGLGTVVSPAFAASAGVCTASSGPALWYTATNVPAGASVSVRVTPQQYFDPVITFATACGSATCNASSASLNSSTVDGTPEAGVWTNSGASPANVTFAVSSNNVNTAGKFDLDVRIQQAGQYVSAGSLTAATTAVCTSGTPNTIPTLTSGTTTYGQLAAAATDALPTGNTCTTQAAWRPSYFRVSVPAGQQLVASATPRAGFSTQIRLFDAATVTCTLTAAMCMPNALTATATASSALAAQPVGASWFNSGTSSKDIIVAVAAYGSSTTYSGPAPYALTVNVAAPAYGSVSAAPSAGSASCDDMGSATQWLTPITTVAMTGNDANTTTGTTYQPFRLPFAFTFFGRTTDRWAASSNGWLQVIDGTLPWSSSSSSMWSNSSFQTDASPGNTPPSWTTVSPATASGSSWGVIAPFWDDNGAPTTATTEPNVLTAATFGTAPSRRFVVEWSRFWFATTTARSRFQVKLYEADNSIEFHYCSLQPTTDTGTMGSSATIGIAANDRVRSVLGSVNTQVTGLNGARYRFVP